MGQKLNSKLLFVYSPNSDGFYIVYISRGSVAVQLRCGLLQICHRMQQWKNFENRSIIRKDMDKTL